MARRERKAAENGPDGRPAKSASFRKNPRKHAGTVAIGREKAPTENSWGFNSGGGGGNRTRVQMPFHKQFYMRSRLFCFSESAANQLPAFPTSHLLV